MRDVGVSAYADSVRQHQDAVVTEHMQLVRRIALHLSARLPVAVQVDDLVQAGMVGLLEAARKYDAGKGANFTTFASHRIRGAMLDEIRRGDWVPRSVHRNAREIATAMARMKQDLGREPSDRELANELDVSVEKLHHMIRDAASAKLTSFEDESEDEQAPSADSEGPLQSAIDAAFRDRLASAIAALSEREQLVISLYHEQELNLKEIGEVLGVTESRVSQIHSKAMLRLRTALAEWRG